MCKCNPNIKTPWCGKEGCEVPEQKKCGCGEPETKGVIHRKDLPCYWEEPKQSWEEDLHLMVWIMLRGEPTMQKQEKFDALKAFIQKEIIKAEIRIREDFIRELEEKYGKYESFHGSLGYQGIMKGIDSFETEKDKMRDEIINSLDEKILSLKLL
jgi:hypothetical protein